MANLEESIKNVIFIEDEKLNREIFELMINVMKRIPSYDREFIRKGLAKVTSMDKEGAVFAGTRPIKEGEKCEIAIFFPSFRELSQKAKLGIIAHELAHVKEFAEHGPLGGDIFGESSVQDTLTVDWNFRGEVRAYEEVMPPRPFFCLDCQHEWKDKHWPLRCPNCGSFGVEIQ